MKVSPLFRFLWVIFTLVLLPAQGQAATSSEQPSAQLEKVSLQLKWFHQFQFAGYYAAIQQGYYAEEGLDVEIKERILEKNFVQQVTSGEADYGVGDSGLLSQYAKGEKITALAAIFQHNPLVFMAKQTSGIISPFEMRGKRVMSDIVSTNEAPLRAMLAGTGITEQDFQLIPQSNDYSQLISGKVDVISGYLTDQPFYFKQQGVKINIINPQNYGIDFYGDILYTSQLELEQHPGRADRFLRASLKGWRYALDHPEELIQLIRKQYKSKLSVEHLRFEAAETKKLILADVIPIGQIKISRMKIVGDIYAGAGLNQPLSEDDLSTFIYQTSTTALNLSPEEKVWLAKHPVIKVGIDRDFAPYEWIDEHGHYKGLAADYMRLLEKKLGVRFEIIKDQSWSDILSMAKRNELDMLSFAVETDDRTQYLTFTEPYKTSPTVIIDNNQDEYIGNLKHLVGKRVAIEKGYFMGEFLQKDYPLIQLLEVSNTANALKMVAEGQADAYVGDAGLTNYAIKKEGLLGLRFSGQTEYSSQHSVAVTQSNPELVGIINKAMKSIPQDEADAIFNQWMGLRIEQGVKPETLMQYGAVLLLLLAFVGYWIIRMRREIAMRKNTEKRLFESHALLNKVVESVPMRIFWKDKHLCFQGCNTLFAKDAGLTSPQELIGKDDFAMIWADRAPLYQADDRAVMESDTSKLFYDEQQTTPSGETIWVRTSKVPLKNQHQELIGVLGTYEDITERKLIEEKLLVSENHAKSVLESSPVPMALNDSEGNITNLNAAFRDILGYTLSDIPTLAEWWPLAYPDLEYRKHVAETWQKRMEEALSSGKPFVPMELNICCKDLSTRIFMCSATQLEGDFSSTHMVVLYDITDSKQAENNLRIAATVFESQEGMVVTDANNIILRVNHAFTQITGYSAEEVIGQTPSMLNSGQQDAAFYEEMWTTLNNAGTWQGEIWNRRKNGEVFPEYLTITTVKDQQNQVTHYVATLMDITLSKAASDEIKNLAFYDSLTQLPNRRLLIDRLNQALAASTRSGQRGAILFIDLDHFKSLNDTMGHDVGDLLLKQVADRLVSCVREGDTVARLGGDEFVVLLEDLSDQELEAAKQTETIAEKIIIVLNQSYMLGSHEHHSTPSVGATLFYNHNADVDALLKQADIAMYQAKDSGRNALRFFDPKMQEAIAFRVDLEHELRKAIDQKQFELHYQAQVNSSGCVIGAEALIRWQHPERGMISPFHFIALAEDTGLILPIGQWVLDTACAQLKLWQQETRTHDLTLSVNVSAKQFLQKDFITQVQTAVEKFAIDASRLKLELTESLLVSDVKDVVMIMSTLSAMGIRFSLDDFGTGYSSLQYLKTLPLNQLKIDQSFVRDIATDNQDKAIVRTIIAMAISLDLNVIAEGVETEEQKQFLFENHCVHYQGYLFGKPMPIDQFEALLLQH